MAGGALTPTVPAQTEQEVLNIYTTKNQWTGAGWDAGTGEMTTLGQRQYTYDAEGRLSSYHLSDGGVTQDASFAYDGEGRRTKKTGTTESVVFVYDAMGQLAAEYGTGPGASGTQYVVQDMLGSTRLVTNGSGIEVRRYDYLPFGQEIIAGVNGRSALYPDGVAIDPQRMKFTGKERDVETGLDYFGARYFSGAQGRFTSPDEWAGGIVDPFTGQQVGRPGPLPYADITDPQTINKYAYVRNNPLRYTDPDGHVIDTLADIGFIAYDIYEIAKGGATTTNVLALGADVVGAVVPFATGLGAAVRAEHAIEAGVHIAEAGIKANKAKGAAAEVKAAGELVSEGKTILGSQVSVQTSQGRRVVDHLTQNAEGKIAGVEVKSGKATRKAAQRAKDAEIPNQGGKVVGKNAPENLRGRKVKFPTEERHYPD